MKLSSLFKIIVDTCMISAGWILAYYLRFHTGLDTPLGIPEPSLYFRLLPFIAVIWWAIFFFAGFYKRSSRHRSAMREAFDILQCSAMATVAFISFTYFYEEYRYSRINTLIFAACHPALLIFGRSFLRKAERFYRRRHPSPKTLFIGTQERLKEALRLMSRNRSHHIQVFGVICLDEIHIEFEQLLMAKSIRLLPLPGNWIEFLVEEPIASAFIAVKQDHPFLSYDIGTVCSQIPEVKIMPDLGNLSGHALGLEIIDGTPIINVHESPMSGTGTVIKRIVDIVGSFALMALLSPLFVIIAVFVRMSSPGPIFYRQERMGLDGSRFNCIKFRSMPTTAEAETGAIWAKTDDQRATFIGKILRRTSLDELPQLFNVLKGDMSLVGPRPERPVFVKEFRHKVPGYMLRHKVKAGITGWAQVNGWRGSTSIEKRIECDLFYIKNWTLWLDFKILFLTIEEVISGKDAY